MTNTKTTKRALLTSVMAMFLCFTMLLGTTFAWFTDTATSSKNKIVAGNLDVELLMYDADAGKYVNISSSQKPIFESGETANETQKTLWEPGKTNVAYLAIENAGNLDLKYKVALDVKNVKDDLYKVMSYTISPDVMNGVVPAWDAANAKTVVPGVQEVTTAEGELGKGETHYFALSIHMDENAGNEYKNAEVDFDLIVLATQLNAEFDSLGDTYDKDASYAGEVNTVDELKNLLAKGGSAKLASDMTLTEPLSVPAGVSVTLDLNGKTLSGKMTKDAGAVITNNGTLTITGSGTVENTEVNGGAVISNSGTLTLKGGSYIGSPISGDTAYPAYAINTTGDLTVEAGTSVTSDRGAINATGGNIVVNGGSFTTTNAAASRPSAMTLHTIAAQTGSTVTIYDGSFQNNYTGVAGSSVICPWGGTINIYGGTFSDAVDDTSNFNNTANFQNYMGYSAPVNVYGGTYDDSTFNKHVVTGYEVIDNGDGTWTVSVPQITDSSSLNNAITNGGVYELATDITMNSSMSNDLSLDLNGNTLEATSTLKLANNADLTVTDGDYVVNSTFGHVDVRPTSTEGSVVTFENVDFSFNTKSKTYGPSTNRLGSVVEICAEVADANTTVVFKNCTFDNAQVVFEGLTDKIGSFNATFENCTFNALTSSAPIYVQNYVTGTLTVTGCTFNLECTSSSASAISINSSTSTAVTLNASNNTLNATAATPYTYDAAAGETEVDNVKVNGTPANIKFVSIGGTTSTANVSGTTVSGIAVQ